MSYPTYLQKCYRRAHFTGRLFRDGKAAISAKVARILERPGSSALSWWSRIENLGNGRLLGRFFAARLGRSHTAGHSPRSISISTRSRHRFDVGSRGRDNRRIAESRHRNK